jgi:hypothetical protein
MRTKIKLYKTLIRSIATYGSEVSTLTKENELSLRIFERKIIRKIYGPIKMNEEWKIRINEEIENILGNENIVRFTYILCRQMYTVLCYLTQFLLNAAQHVASLYKAHLQGLFR